MFLRCFLWFGPRWTRWQLCQPWWRSAQSTPSADPPAASCCSHIKSSPIPYAVRILLVLGSSSANKSSSTNFVLCRMQWPASDWLLSPGLSLIGPVGVTESVYTRCSGGICRRRADLSTLSCRLCSCARPSLIYRALPPPAATRRRTPAPHSPHHAQISCYR